MNSPEDLLTLGATFLFFLAVFCCLGLLLASWTLQLAAGMLGTRPSFLASVGTTMGIGLANTAIVGCAQITLGPEQAWMVAPVTWFVTVFLVSKLADCGLIKGFFIWILNAIFATLGFVVLMLVTLIPISMMGDGFAEPFQELAAKMEQVEAEDDWEIQTETLPEVQNASFQPSQNPFGADSQNAGESSVADAFFQADDEDVSDSGFTPSAAATKPPQVKTRRAKDGSTLNPFFDQ